LHVAFCLTVAEIAIAALPKIPKEITPLAMGDNLALLDRNKSRAGIDGVLQGIGLADAKPGMPPTHALN
jgi:hypothetical protein